jgi:hypothetical protein
LVALIQKESERADAAVEELEAVVAGLEWEEPWQSERATVDQAVVAAPTESEPELPVARLDHDGVQRFAAMRKRVTEAVSAMGLDSTATELRSIAWSLAEHGRAWLSRWLDSQRQVDPAGIRQLEIDLAHLEDAYARAEANCQVAGISRRLDLSPELELREVEQRVAGLDAELRAETARQTKLALENLKYSSAKSSGRFRSVPSSVRQAAKPGRERNVGTLQAWFGSLRTRLVQFLESAGSDSKQSVRLQVQAIASEMALMQCEHKHLEPGAEFTAIMSELAAYRESMCQVVKTRLRTMPSSIRYLECCEVEPEALMSDYEEDRASLNEYMRSRQPDTQSDVIVAKSELDANGDKNRFSQDRFGESVRAMSNT